MTIAVFFLGGVAENAMVELNSLATLNKMTISNLAVKLDADLKFESQMRGVKSLRAAGQSQANSFKSTL